MRRVANGCFPVALALLALLAVAGCRRSETPADDGAPAATGESAPARPVTSAPAEKEKAPRKTREVPRVVAAGLRWDECRTILRRNGARDVNRRIQVQYEGRQNQRTEQSNWYQLGDGAVLRIVVARTLEPRTPWTVSRFELDTSGTELSDLAAWERGQQGRAPLAEVNLADHPEPPEE